MQRLELVTSQSMLAGDSGSNILASCQCVAVRIGENIQEVRQPKTI